MFKAGQLIQSIYAAETDEECYGTFLVLSVDPGTNLRYMDTDGNTRSASSLFSYYKLLSPNGEFCSLRDDQVLQWKVVSQ